MTSVVEALEQARQLIRGGQFREAEPIYQRLVELAPNLAELWAELGFVQLKLVHSAALESLRTAVALAPGNAAFQTNLGTAYRMEGQLELAVECYRRALEIGPPSPALHSNLGLALKNSGQSAAALESFDEALRLRPDYVNGMMNRANLLRDLGRLADAAAGYEQLLAHDPRDAGAWCSLGVTYYDLGQLDAALAAYDRALAIQPDYADARRNRALIWLARGAYDRGWSEYEWRLECEGSAKRDLPLPRWDGTPLEGRKLFVYAEQGLGDTLQFIRYVPRVHESGGKIGVEVQMPLVPLLAQSEFESYLVPAAPADFDVHCPLLSMPGLVAGDKRPFWRGPYLRSDPRRAAGWAERLREIGGCTVGIAWAGNPQHPHDRYRSVSLSRFAPLAAVEGVRLVNLQKGVGSDQLAECPFDVVDLPGLDESDGAFLDTVAVIEQLDLVVTVDTAIAHVAGALGARVWLALEYSPDWRWGVEGETTPWYPSMRLFRQQGFDAWQPVFGSMAAALVGLTVEGR